MAQLIVPEQNLQPWIITHSMVTENTSQTFWSENDITNQSYNPAALHQVELKISLSWALAFTVSSQYHLWQVIIHQTNSEGSAHRKHLQIRQLEKLFFKISSDQTFLGSLNDNGFNHFSA